MAATKKINRETMNNPAMAFINTPAEEPEELATTEEAELKAKAGTPSKKVRGRKPAAELPKHKTNEAPEGYKVNPLYVETKSKRVNVLMQPSLHDKLKKLAKANNLSVNEFIHTILEAAVKED